MISPHKMPIINIYRANHAHIDRYKMSIITNTVLLRNTI